MAKRSDNEWDTERVEVSDESEAVVAAIEAAADETETVRLVLLQDLTLNATGPVTGKLYRFFGAGYELDVDKEDADIMLKKRGAKACCGGSPSPYYFDIVE